MQLAVGVALALADLKVVLRRRAAAMTYEGLAHARCRPETSEAGNLSHLFMCEGVVSSFWVVVGITVVAEELTFFVIAWVEIVWAAVHDTDLGTWVKCLQRVGVGAREGERWGRGRDDAPHDSNSSGTSTSSPRRLTTKQRMAATRGVGP